MATESTNTVGGHSIKNSMNDETSQKPAEANRTGTNSSRTSGGTGPQAASGGNVSKPS